MQTLKLVREISKMENGRPLMNNQYTIGPRSVMVCKMHPRHKQSPGVCSVCLGERLSQIPASSSSSTVEKASTISSCPSSFSSSSYNSSLEGSPVHHKHRMASMKHGTMSGFLKAKREDLFRKSKSVAVVERVREREGEERERKNKKKKGFWSKLLRPRKKKIEVGLAHSNNMVTTRVY